MHRLLLKVEFFDDSSVTLLVVQLQILQMCAAVCNHLQKSAARVLVFKMFLQMRRKLIDSLAQYSDLNLRRTGVLVMNSRFFDDFRLFRLRKHVSI